jgi:hypothetical protein
MKEASAVPAQEGVRRTPGQIIQGMHTSEEVCFDGETHQAQQDVVRESISCGARSS